jgi:DNA processing protein
VSVDFGSKVDVAALREAAATLDPAELLQQHLATGVDVVLAGDAHYPERLLADEVPPAFLCVIGALPIHRRPAVGIVGTRRASAYGRNVAAWLGEALSRAGVTVVSGLATGIDGAAHEGALRGEAPPLAVVAGGPDAVYPPRHRTLWAAVGAAGAVIAEAALGTAPVRWRFPARNRIIAALSDVLVVVESDHGGGSMHTVREAEQRGRTVMAVPGPIRTRSSAGTNDLLAEGCPPVRDPEDILMALGLCSAGAPVPQGEASARGMISVEQASRGLPVEDESRCTAAARRLLELVPWQPVTLDQLAGSAVESSAARNLDEVLNLVTELAVEGFITMAHGLVERAR